MSLTKLKWQQLYFTRDILPAQGLEIGKILYTTKNTTGRRAQYVLDLDQKTAKVTTIDAFPADKLTSPGQIVTLTTINPKTDASLYIFGGATLPVYAKTVRAEFTQFIANGASIASVNVFAGVTRNGALATPANSTVTVIAAHGLTLNTNTGAVTLDDNLTAGTYTVEYKIADKNEPSVYVTGIVTVTVDVAP